MTNQRQHRLKEDKNKNVIQELQEFGKDSINFFNKCSKPSRAGKSLPLDTCAEYLKILSACAMGFLVIGFIGYIIKLVFIPINNIILGA